ncbi:hypothetical protein ASE08_07210 [Rhizobacter sp. Root16D2]|nr:hypothetical protein ASC88_24465 [Rhizobacter sp. Root29]KQW06896.1 hypothetical protein ASC98_25995 [Rhizobacter sp. Root1238]KRB18984.1 hypothetical protein ASE08_07210 [Rhizobacter sp. Root16D2]
MGVVYRAFDPAIQRPVAIKVILRKLLDHDRTAALVAARFRNEARAVGRLSHPGIVAIYEYGEDDACAFIAMELVEGRSLGRILSHTPLLSEAEVLRIMDQLLDALECVHRHGVWHRDIKPENLIVTPRGEVKLADFGIARVEDVALTQGSPGVGTPGYMAPEQYTAGGLDHRVDIFAAGVLLYRLLTGEVPFKGRSRSVMRATLDDDPPVPSATATTTRHAFYDSIVSTALAKDPGARFASAAQFRDALSKRSEVAPAISSCVDGIEVQALAAPWFADATITTSWAGLDSCFGTTDVTGSEPLGPDVLAHACRVLASQMGPIAAVVVKRAAGRAHTRAEFFHLLVVQSADGVDRAKLRRELQQGPV